MLKFYICIFHYCELTSKRALNKNILITPHKRGVILGVVAPQTTPLNELVFNTIRLRF